MNSLEKKSHELDQRLAAVEKRVADIERAIRENASVPIEQVLERPADQAAVDQAAAAG